MCVLSVGLKALWLEGYLVQPLGVVLDFPLTALLHLFVHPPVLNARFMSGAGGYRDKPPQVF